HIENNRKGDHSKVAKLIKTENISRSLTKTEDVHNKIFGKD
ncbi:31625_t:CDS:1, partial [Gigaspora margarita]